jgi:hypothetical protein
VVAAWRRCYWHSTNPMSGQGTTSDFPCRPATSQTDIMIRAIGFAFASRSSPNRVSLLQCYAPCTCTMKASISSSPSRPSLSIKTSLTTHHLPMHHRPPRILMRPPFPPLLPNPLQLLLSSSTLHRTPSPRHLHIRARNPPSSPHLPLPGGIKAPNPRVRHNLTPLKPRLRGPHMQSPPRIRLRPISASHGHPQLLPPPKNRKTVWPPCLRGPITIS